MSYFKQGPSPSALGMFSLVIQLLRSDRERVFPWEDYLESIMQSCMLKLLSNSSSSYVGEINVMIKRKWYMRMKNEKNEKNDTWGTNHVAGCSNDDTVTNSGIY